MPDRQCAAGQTGKRDDCVCAKAQPGRSEAYSRSSEKAGELGRSQGQESMEGKFRKVRRILDPRLGPKSPFCSQVLCRWGKQFPDLHSHPASWEPRQDFHARPAAS